MAFMMPVMKNDWDIYNSRTPRRPAEGSERSGGGGGGRVRKVSESRSEGPLGAASRAALSPHRSAPAMRSLGYGRTAPPSRGSLRAADSPRGSASPRAPPKPADRGDDKFHTRARDDSPERGRSRCAACVPYL